MSEKESSVTFLSRIWTFFASIKLTVVVLLSLAATSIVGTIIPQNESPSAYFQEYGPVLYKVFSALDIFNMYHSWWFQLLMIILTMNIIVCSINRLSSTWKVLFVKVPPFNASKFRGISDKEEFSVHRSPDELRAIYEPYISRKFSYCRVEDQENGFCIFGEKGRLVRLGVYVVHLSVVMLLVGGLIGSIFGFDGFVNLPEGETVQEVRLKGSQEVRPLGFRLRCDKFKVSFYDTGSPKEYRATLSVIENAKTVLTKDVIVNDPLRYGGISFYQSSYGTYAPKEVTLNFTSNQTGMGYKEKMVIGQKVDIPEGMGTFVLNGYRKSFLFRGRDLGEAFVGTLNPDTANAVQVGLPLKFPSFDKMRKGEISVTVSDYISRYYTGLQVVRDPGVFLVYLGFITMIIGCFVTFFMSHQRICVEVCSAGQKSKVMVAGTSNKNKLGLKTKISQIAQKLAAMV
ncbi:MAG: cytochrome c biogenesis protein ResB [Desulfobacterales bacterium]|nr:cytochrome c biogenesis protein ResB [Desulfobacterales bacterium]MDD4071128.1 cytochrome c biogenesis protein ResB [Desulfobacterales bacterium]MDD4393529.1 cytochrome c biogenesis protein ResB [Desulfobacterales bacterium]